MNIELKFSQLEIEKPYAVLCFSTLFNQRVNKIGYVLEKTNDKVLIHFLTEPFFLVPPTVSDVEKLKNHHLNNSYKYIYEEELNKGIYKISPIDKEVFLKLIEKHKEYLLRQLKPLVENIKTLTKFYNKVSL